MATATEVFAAPDVESELRKFSVSDAAIAKLSKEYMPLKVNGIDDAKGLKAVHAARMTVKGLRVEVEKTRKFLKEDALRYGRSVDAEARRITSLLEPIETHLEKEENAVAIEKERIRKAAEDAARAKAEAEAKAIRDAEEARLRAERDAEEARLKAEREKLDAERAAMKAEQDKLDAIRKQQEAEAAKLQSERQRIADEDAARQRAIELEKAKADAAEKARIETEARLKREADAAEAKRIADEQRAKEEAERIEAMRPDVERVQRFADVLNAIQYPEVQSERAKLFILSVYNEIGELAKRCADFKA